MKKILIFLIGLFGISLAQSDIKSISVEEMIKQKTADSTMVILDVRTPQELKGQLGQIKGVINIPVQELEKRIKELESYKKNKIAVICRSGNRSRMGTKILIKHGFNAVNVSGGMKAYNKMISK